MGSFADVRREYFVDCVAGRGLSLRPFPGCRASDSSADFASMCSGTSAGMPPPAASEAGASRRCRWSGRRSAGRWSLVTRVQARRCRAAASAIRPRSRTGASHSDAGSMPSFEHASTHCLDSVGGTGGAQRASNSVAAAASSRRPLPVGADLLRPRKFSPPRLIRLGIAAARGCPPRDPAGRKPANAGSAPRDASRWCTSVR